MQKQDHNLLKNQGGESNSEPEAEQSEDSKAVEKAGTQAAHACHARHHPP